MNCKIEMTYYIKRLIAGIMLLAVLLGVCSCTETKYWSLKSYINNNADVEVAYIDEWEYEKDDKTVRINIALKKGATPSLEELDSLRNALSDFMSRKGGFLEQGWKVTVIVSEYHFADSSKPHIYAYIQNHNDNYTDVSNTMNTFCVLLSQADVSYIASLSGVENLYIVDFVQDDNGLAESVLHEIEKLDELKTLTISSDWYELFSEAGLDCKIFVSDDLVDIFK
ncbi:MAG: hypothetical protein IKG30_07700 [Clostridiales bacterium]|nr:hypothetical protein [Clostridiales bacterium]